MPDEIDSIPEIPATASAIAPGTLDRCGVPFDPARHITKKHPVSGRWMPKGGRKPKSASASSVSTYSPPVRTEPAPASEPSAISSPSPAASPAAPAAEPVAAPSLADIERAANTPAPVEAEKAAEKAEEARAVVIDAAEQQADTLWRALYSVAGAATGAPEETTRSGAAHANNRAALAAWMVESNIRIKGVWGLVIVVVCYFAETGTKPKTRAWVARLMEKMGKKKPVPVPVAQAVTQEPAPAPVAEARPAVAAQPSFVEKY